MRCAIAHMPLSHKFLYMFEDSILYSLLHNVVHKNGLEIKRNSTSKQIFDLQIVVRQTNLTFGKLYVILSTNTTDECSAKLSISVTTNSNDSSAKQTPCLIIVAIALPEQEHVFYCCARIYSVIVMFWSPKICFVKEMIKYGQKFCKNQSLGCIPIFPSYIRRWV